MIEIGRSHMTSLRVRILHVKSSDDRYYLELKTEGRVLEKLKKKMIAYIRK